MSSRFRTLTPDAEQHPDDQISIDLDRFEAELAATIAKFDARQPGVPTMPPRDLTLNEPLSRLPDGLFASPAAPARQGDPATATDTAPGPAAAPPPALRSAPDAGPSGHTTPPPGLDLLSELRLVAEEKATQESNAEADRKARVEHCDLAMRRLFKYLAEFAGHLDKIQPPLPQTFRSPLPGIELSALRWLDSFIDYRTNGGTETSPLDSISFRYMLGTGKPVSIEKLPNHAGAYLEELKRFGLRYQMIEHRGSKGMTERVEFRVEPSLTVSLLFKAVPDSGEILLKTRHLTSYPEFDLTEYRLAAAEVNQTLLDELGKHILGRQNHLLQHIKKV